MPILTGLFADLGLDVAVEPSETPRIRGEIVSNGRTVCLESTPRALGWSFG